MQTVMVTGHNEIVSATVYSFHDKQQFEAEEH